MKPDCRERHRARSAGDARESRSAGDGHARESRCACGSLLARLTAEGVELKCRRCKRLVIVRWSDEEHRALAERSRYPP